MKSGTLGLAVLLLCSLPCFAQTPEGAAASTEGTPELDLQSYRQELARIEGSSKNPQELRELRRSLPDSWVVKDGDRIYRVPTKEISEALVAIERDPKKTTPAEQLRARLSLMRQQAEALAVAGSGLNRVQAAAKLKNILDRGEFQAAAGPSSWDLMRARMNRWIVQQIIKLLNLLHISEKTGNSIAWGVIFLAAVLVFYVLYRWLSKAAKDVSFRAEAEPVASDARQWVQEALAAADRGEFREAIHCAYWASVAHLEDIRVLPRDRSRTPRESLRMLEHHPKEQGLLQTITRSFELIWYGYRPASAGDWAGAKEQLEKMGCLQALIAPTAPS